MDAAQQNVAIGESANMRYHNVLRSVIISHSCHVFVFPRLSSVLTKRSSAATQLSQRSAAGSSWVWSSSGPDCRCTLRMDFPEDDPRQWQFVDEAEEALLDHPGRSDMISSSDSEMNFYAECWASRKRVLRALQVSTWIQIYERNSFLASTQIRFEWYWAARPGLTSRVGLSIACITWCSVCVERVASSSRHSFEAQLVGSWCSLY